MSFGKYDCCSSGFYYRFGLDIRIAIGRVIILSLETSTSRTIEKEGVVFSW